MVAGRAIRAGRAAVELYLHDKDFQRGLKRAQYKMKRFGRAVQATGQKMMAMGAAGAAAMYPAIKAAADFEQQMANVSTMLDRPEEHMDDFRTGVRRMSKEFGESTDTLSKGLYDILSASIAPEKALGVLEESARAAKAGLTDTGTAADAVTTILNSFSMEAEEAGHVTDVLFQTVREGKTTFAELAPQIGDVAATAANAGVELEEMGAMLAVLTRNGLKTERATTALNRIVTSFMKPSKQAAEAAEKFGIELSTVTLESEGLIGTFQKLQDLSPDELAQVFPNIRSLRGVIPAMQNLEGATDSLQAMYQSAGASSTAFEKNTDTLTHKFNQAKQAVIDQGRAIGQRLMPTVSELLGKAEDLVDKYGDWIASHADLIAKGTLFLLKWGAILTVTGKFIALLGKIPAMASGAATAIKALNTSVMELNASTSIMAGAGMVAGGFIAAKMIMERVTEGYADLNKAKANNVETTKRQLDADRERLQTLQKLADKQNLTSDEMAKAQGIIKKLESRYGDLGVTLNTATGEIEGMAKAWENFRDKAPKKRKQALKSDINIMQKELERRQAELEKLADEYGPLKNLEELLTGKRGERIRNIQQRSAKLTDRLTEARKELQRLGEAEERRERMRGKGRQPQAPLTEPPRPLEEMVAGYKKELRSIRAETEEEKYRNKRRQVEEKYQQQIDQLNKLLTAKRIPEGMTVEDIMSAKERAEKALQAKLQDMKEKHEAKMAKRRLQNQQEIEKLKDRLAVERGEMTREELEKANLERQRKMALAEARAQGAGEEALARIRSKYDLKSRIQELSRQASGLQFRLPGLGGGTGGGFGLGRRMDNVQNQMLTALQQSVDKLASIERNTEDIKENPGSVVGA